MSEAADPAEPPAPQYPPELEALINAAQHYAKARAKLPAPGKVLCEADAKAFQAYTVALLAYERAGMAFVGRSVKQ